jgi:hypothetical protein
MSELQVSARMTIRRGQLERFREQVTDCTGSNVVYLESVVFVGIGVVILALAVTRTPSVQAHPWTGLQQQASAPTRAMGLT